MAIIANTFLTYSAIGNREDLSDVIFNVAPTDTPLLSGAKKGTAQNTLVEWQADTLASAVGTGVVEGDDVTAFTAVVPTVRFNNRCQISRRDVLVSDTQRVMNTAGRDDEYDYIAMNRANELKRDIETAITQNTVLITGSSAVARGTRGLEGWTATNNSVGAGGVAPVPTTNTAPTDGTQRAFTEALLRTVHQSVYTAGGNPNVLLVGPAQKTVVSTFTGNSTRFMPAEPQKLVASIDIYVGDFGEMKVVPDRFQRARTAFLLQMDMIEVAFLRPIQSVQLAKTGDATKGIVVAEYALKVYNEAAIGAVRDLT